MNAQQRSVNLIAVEYDLPVDIAKAIYISATMGLVAGGFAPDDATHSKHIAGLTVAMWSLLADGLDIAEGKLLRALRFAFEHASRDAMASAGPQEH